jgi:endonuclease/exonuclease/phosphatase family metal-dependent hydrolase
VGTVRVRLLSYNVHHCQGMDGRVAPERVARLIGRQDPDIVALQELDVHRARTRNVDQPKLIGDLLRMDVHFHSTLKIAREQYGTAVLSRWPLRKIRSSSLPSLAGRKLENRAALWVRVDVGGTELHVVNTHLGLTRGERRLQAEALLGPEWLGHPDCREPRVLCGDFNMSGGREVTCFDGLCVPASWSRVGPPPKTWPSFLPFLALDRVFVSPKIEVESVFSPRDGLARIASDHLPVVATLLLRA